MGYWANDGSYKYDENDIRLRERMNESQGQYYDRTQRGVAAIEEAERREKERAAAEKEFEARVKRESMEEERASAIARQEKIDKAMATMKEEDNIHRYGTDIDLRNPQTLEDRRARANFWRLNNTFRLLIDNVTGKNKKFEDLWDKFRTAKSDEERLKIVEQMEKMYPTKTSAINAVEKKVRSGK